MGSYKAATLASIASMSSIITGVIKGFIVTASIGACNFY